MAETPSYYALPREHWRSLRTNNPRRYLKADRLAEPVSVAAVGVAVEKVQDV